MKQTLILILAFSLFHLFAFSQSVIFPQEQQAGAATASVVGNAYTLTNELFSASFVLNEGKLTFGGCGSGMVEVYADFALMNSINGGKLWGDLAECIRWHKAQEDVLPDVHWVGGNPWDGSKANVYGWAAWNGEKATLALRNPSTSAQTFTTTLREALDIPTYIHTSITLTDAFKQKTLSGLTTGEPIDIDTPLTLNLAGSSVYIYNGDDDTITSIEDCHPFGEEMINGKLINDQCYDLEGRKLVKPQKNGINIIEGKKVLSLYGYRKQ